MVDQRIGERVSMRELASLLGGLDDAPWSRIDRGRPLSAAQLGARLRQFQVEPKPIRFSCDRVARGYERSAFLDAFERYLPRISSVTPVTSLESHGDFRNSDWLPSAIVTPNELSERPNDLASVTDVTAHRAPHDGDRLNGQGAQ